MNIYIYIGLGNNQISNENALKTKQTLVLKRSKACMPCSKEILVCLAFGFLNKCLLCSLSSYAASITHR